MSAFEKIPGFTADASLGRTVRQYRTAALHRSPQGNVIPQLRRSTGFCMADCDSTDPDPLSNFACKIGCLDAGGDGEGGGTEPVCTPVCGPCVKAPGALRGTKTCVTSNCNDRQVRC